MKKRLVVYTAIFNGRDRYREPSSGDFDCVLFTDKPIETNRTRVVVVPNVFPEDPVRTARFFKLMPQLFFYEYEYTMWRDGQIDFKEPIDVDALTRAIGNASIATLVHRERTCVYQELEKCTEFLLDDPETMRRQVEGYRQEGYPALRGLSETGVVLRRAQPESDAFNFAWWRELSTKSRRDQLSFDYVAWKLGIKVAHFPGDVSCSPYFTLVPHTSK